MQPLAGAFGRWPLGEVGGLQTGPPCRPIGRVKLLDDADKLLAEAQAGDPDWGAIYRIVRLPMYRAVWRVLRPQSSYDGICDDDIVAEAFLEVVRRDLDGTHSLVGIARVTAYRRAIDLVRKQNKEVVCLAFEETIDDEDLAEELRRKDELCCRAMECAERLPHHQRIALLETVLSRRPVKEVAAHDLGGVSTQAVYALRRKAIANVQRCLGDP